MGPSGLRRDPASVTSEDGGTGLKPVPVLGFAWLGPIVGPLGTAGLVLVTVIFMLLERRDLRDRLFGLVGHGRLASTTKAIDEAGASVSRQLLLGEIPRVALQATGDSSDVALGLECHADVA
jgi:predicted PurR-regulated permease PerM